MTRPLTESSRRPTFGVLGLALAMAVLALVAPSGNTATVEATVASDQATNSVGTASAYVAINPIRVLDTRSDEGIRRVYDNSAFSIDPVTDTGVAASAGVDPDEITAVIVNTTLVRAGGGGFGTVWPTGTERLATSTNNTEFVGHTIPNLVIAPLGLDNKISVYASVNVDVILDVLGVFVASDATDAGRFESLGPIRAYDSREADPELAANRPQTIDLKPFGVPADATGVVLNVTSVRARGGGFYRVWPADRPEPAHSSVNVLGVNYVAGNQVITGVSNGRIQVSSNVAGGLTVDVTGYFTGSGAEISTDGLFVPFAPERLLDTRERSGATAGTNGQPISANARYGLQVTGRPNVPIGSAEAVALNLTAARSTAAGFVKAYPQGAAEPPTSSLNFANPGQIVPNHAITSVNPTNGQITLMPSVNTHLIADATGYFLAPGAPIPAGGDLVTKTVDPGNYVPAQLFGSSPTSGPYDFLFDRATYFGQGIRPFPTIKAAWHPCEALRYALNIDLAANDEQIEVLIESIEEVEAATGVDLQFAGVTSAGMNVDDPIILPELAQTPFRYLPPDDNGSGLVDVVIGFSGPSGTPELAGGVIGLGGSLRDDTDSDGRAEQFRGFAIIDVRDLEHGNPSSARALSNIKATTTHELGHLMGLGHVDTSTRGGGLVAGFSDAEIEDQLMFPALTAANEPHYDDGDLRGLFELYANRPCAASDSLGGPGDAPSDIDWNAVSIVKIADEH